MKNLLFNLKTKIIRKLILLNYLLNKRYSSLNSQSLIKQQNELFLCNNFDRDEGIRLINEVCLDLFNKEFNEDDGMFAEHLVLFACISLSQKFNINNILEIGTFDGRTAAIFSRLFPNASITTIDLEVDSENYIDTYDRSQNYQEFNHKRDSLLSHFQNVSFKELNSINLANFEANSFDLIWIDGAHGYPIIAMDIVNSIRLVNSEGVIMIDDVFTKNKINHPFYKSIGAYESLLALQEAKSIDGFILFLKRVGYKHNISNSQKYVGFIRS